MRTTRSQKKKRDRSCPITRVVALMGDTCSLLIVRDLLQGMRRFGELEDSLCGTSPRTLTRKLRKLESEGMISRHPFRRHPPRVEYQLTKKGKAFYSVVEAMRVYGTKYL